jgi:hypothetical protein
MDEVLQILKAIQAEQAETNRKFDRLETKVDVLTEGLAALRESFRDLEDKVELLQGSIIRIDGQGVEAMALVRFVGAP